MIREPNDRHRDLFRRCAAFRLLDEATISELIAQARPQRFGAGHPIVRHGQPTDEVYLIAKGRVKLFVASPRGQEVLLDILREGDIAGDVGLDDGQRQSTDAHALDPTDTLALPNRALIGVARRAPALAVGLVTMLQSRLQRTTELLECTLFLDASTRLLRRIERFAKSDGEALRGSVRVNHRLSQEMLGQAIGVSRETVNKQLNVWREMGFLEVGRGFVVVHDWDSLRAAVESSNGSPAQADENQSQKFSSRLTQVSSRPSQRLA